MEVKDCDGEHEHNRKEGEGKQLVGNSDKEEDSRGEVRLCLSGVSEGRLDRPRARSHGRAG